MKKIINVNVTANLAEANAITHAGKFHADEVFSTIMLAFLYGDLKVARVFKAPAETSAVVYDVGFGELDHHQKGGNGVRENGVPYAACGLVWRKFGKDVLKVFECPKELLDAVWTSVDENFVQAIDANDVGYALDPDGNMRYKAATVSGLVSSFNPTWDSEASFDDAFVEVCRWAAEAFENEVERAISSARAESLVREAYAKADGGVMILDRFLPWQKPLLEVDENGDVLYVTFPSIRGGYNVQCVPASLETFEQRKPFPDSWKACPEATGIADCTFVHANGFMAACESLDGAVALARAAVEA
jgi:uncharacterized UPF0160 family protein